MTRLNHVMLIGACVVVGFDAVMALASRGFGFSYASVAYASWLIYAAVGYFAALRCGIWAAAGVGGVMGLVDASLGWAVSWAIGPGRPVGITMTVSIWVVTALLVAASGVVCGALGGLCARLTKRRAHPDDSPSGTGRGSARHGPDRA